jgi:hypothetical protein
LIFMAASWQQNLAVLVGHRRQGMAWIGSAAVCRAAGELARWAVRCRRPDGVGSGGRDPLGLCMGLALQPRRCDRSGLGCCGLASWQRWSLPGAMQLPTNHGFVPEDLEDAGASAPLESEADRTWPHRPAPRVHAQEHPAARDSPVGTPAPVWSGPSSKQRYRSIATGRLASAAVSPDARSCRIEDVAPVDAYAQVSMIIRCRQSRRRFWPSARSNPRGARSPSICC